MTDQKAETRTADEAGGIEGLAVSAKERVWTTTMLLGRLSVELSARIEAGDYPKELEGLLRDVGKAHGFALEVLGRMLDAERKRERGGGYDRDDALREVRRRMAVLRGAGCGGGAAR